MILNRSICDHIAVGATLVHDKEKSPQKRVNKLALISEAYDSRDLKRLDDSDNPLDPVNNFCRLLQLFLRAHGGFMRSDI